MRKNNYQLYKEIVYTLLKNKCNKCGSITKLDIHHKDSDYNNNTLINLELLCEKCHIQYHTDLIMKKALKSKDYAKFYLNKEGFFEWICPKCKIQIESLYTYQFILNKIKHEMTHKSFFENIEKKEVD